MLLTNSPTLYVTQSNQSLIRLKAYRLVEIMPDKRQVTKLSTRYSFEFLLIITELQLQSCLLKKFY